MTPATAACSRPKLGMDVSTMPSAKSSAGVSAMSQTVRACHAPVQSTRRMSRPRYQPPTTHMGSARCVMSHGIFSPAMV